MGKGLCAYPSTHHEDAQVGEGIAPHILNLNMIEASGQLHALATYPSTQKQPPKPTELEAGWAPDLVQTQQQGGKLPSLSCQEVNPGHPACSIVTIRGCIQKFLD